MWPPAKDQGRKAQLIAALQARGIEGDLEWTSDGFRVQAWPEKTMSMQGHLLGGLHPGTPGWKTGLEAVSYYAPPTGSTVRRLSLRDETSKSITGSKDPASSDG